MIISFFLISFTRFTKIISTTRLSSVNTELCNIFFLLTYRTSILHLFSFLILLN
nr:MAG TPA: hypothetical protein [Caudoviricetes sp.]